MSAHRHHVRMKEYVRIGSIYTNVNVRQDITQPTVRIRSTGVLQAHAQSTPTVQVGSLTTPVTASQVIYLYLYFFSQENSYLDIFKS